MIQTIPEIDSKIIYSKQVLYKIAAVACRTAGLFTGVLICQQTLHGAR